MLAENLLNIMGRIMLLVSILALIEVNTNGAYSDKVTRFVVSLIISPKRANSNCTQCPHFLCGPYF